MTFAPGPNRNDSTRSAMIRDKPIVFRVQSLCKVYPLDEVSVHALRGIDLEIQAGDFTVLLGASGSGKSTLLNMLGGIDIPTSGTIFYRDQNLTHSTAKELTMYRRQSVGFVFQFYNLIPSLTAGENIALVTDISDSAMTPLESLTMVDLADRVNSFPSQLSGGEQQRVAIARAIAKRPDVLLCDEPTGALDLGTGVGVLEAISTVNQSLGTTTIVITHNVSIGQMADRIVTMRDGRIVEDRRNTQKLSPRELQW
ncbi:MAG TPA: ABC transporter [Planctomycetaceae bacterium]|nr:ABC transporter [Planctomycetaceae bacterium]